MASSPASPPPKPPPSAALFYDVLTRTAGKADTESQWTLIAKKTSKFSEAFRSLHCSSHSHSGKPIPMSMGTSEPLAFAPQLMFRHTAATTFPLPSLIELMSMSPAIFMTLSDYTNVIDMLRDLSPAAFLHQYEQLETCAVRCSTCFATSDAVEPTSVALAVPKIDDFPLPHYPHPAQRASVIPPDDDPHIDQRDGKQRVQELYRELLLYMRHSAARYFTFKTTLAAYAARWVALDEEETTAAASATRSAAAARRKPARGPDSAAPSEKGEKNEGPGSAATSEENEEKEEDKGSATEDEGDQPAEGEAAILKPLDAPAPAAMSAASAPLAVAAVTPPAASLPAVAPAAVALPAVPAAPAAASVVAPPAAPVAASVAGDPSKPAINPGPQTSILPPLGSTFNPRYQLPPGGLFMPTAAPRPKPTRRHSTIQARAVKMGQTWTTLNLYLPEAAADCPPPPNNLTSAKEQALENSSLLAFTWAQSAMYPRVPRPTV